MAGDWIKFEKATSDKPEVWAIAERLDMDPDAVVGKLLRVWAWFDDHTENGNAPSVTKKLLDREVGVAGFCDCVVASGWMIEDEDGIWLPNFDRHNGETSKKRALTAKRAAKHRQKSNAESNAGSVTSALPREEQRREEKKKKKPNGGKPPSEYSPEFEQAWSEYPKRAGGNPKSGAWKAWQARIRDGANPDDLLAGVARYRSFIVATGKLGTEYVKQAQTFFGPDKHFSEDWKLPPGMAAGARSFSETDYSEGVNHDGSFQ